MVAMVEQQQQQQQQSIICAMEKAAAAAVAAEKAAAAVAAEKAAAVAAAEKAAAQAAVKEEDDEHQQSNSSTAVIIDSSPPNLKQCDPSELAMYLLRYRFDDDEVATTKFLLEGMGSLPNAQGTADQLRQPDVDERVLESLGSEKQDQNELQVSMTNRHGRFRLVLHERGLCARNLKTTEFMAIPAIRQIVTFPKPEDCVKTTTNAGSMVLLQFHEDITFRKKRLSQICFQFPDKGDVLSWIASLRECFRDEVPLAVVRHPQESSSSSWRFVSESDGSKSTTTGRMPFVKCYNNVHDGVLYPMQEGLLFFKPPLFLSRERLSCIECGRGAGGSSRYVDMTVTLEDDSRHSFTNIERAELRVLNEYVRGVLMKQRGEQQEQSESEEEESDEDDFDYQLPENAEEESDEEDEDDFDEEEGERLLESLAEERRMAVPQVMGVDESDEEDFEYQQPNNNEEDESDDDDDEQFEDDDGERLLASLAEERRTALPEVLGVSGEETATEEEEENEDIPPKNKEEYENSSPKKRKIEEI